MRTLSSRAKRTSAALLALLLLWFSPGVPWSSVCDAGSFGLPRVPLVLVAEPGSRSEGLPQGFIAACEREGYVQGETLFQINPDVFTDLGPGAEQVARLVSACAKRVGGQVDVIACGVSGLVARLAVDAGMIEDQTARNLVMIAAPNRGTFLACLLKSVVEIAKQESLFEKESRSWRFLPTGDDLLSLFSKEGGGDEVLYSRLTYPSDARWSDETSWIVDRVRDVYEPLYARYVTARYSAVPYIPAESPKETFAGWISRTMPQFWQTAVLSSARPPDGLPAFAEGHALVSEAAPPLGKDLSAAYYELLAMQVAKNQYVMRLASKGSLAEDVLKEPYIPSGWKDALLHYGTQVLQYYARKALHAVKAEVQEDLSERIVRRTGYIEDSSSPLLRRFIKEEMAVNLGTSMARRFQQVTANTYLGALNSTSLERSRSRTTRYVSIASRLASPWSLVWPQLGPNDFLLEVDSAVAPTGPRDIQKVFTGLFSPSGEGLLESEEAQDYLFQLIRGDILGTAGEGRVAVSSWGPVYVGTGGLATAVSVTLPDPPSGWQFQTWSETVEGSLADAQSSRFIPTGGAYNLSAALGRTGLRLVRTGAFNPIQGRSVVSAYAQEATVEVAAQHASAAFVDSAGASIEAPGQFPGTSIPPDGSGAGAVDPSLLAYPMVRVVNRSKRTTHKEPEETYHGSWILDYGDGDTETVEGNPDVTFSHIFPRDGSYRVSARSYDNRGDILLEEVWNVTVAGGDDRGKEFRCRSVPHLDVDLRLTGPIMWATGRPAVFSAGIKVESFEGVEVVAVDYDPGPKFCVLWERSGDFVVSCAATVRLRYSIGGEVVSVQNTYLTEQTVSVITTGVTR